MRSLTPFPPRLTPQAGCAKSRASVSTSHAPAKPTLRGASFRRRSSIEATLADLLSEAVRPGEIARPAHLMEAMRYAVLGGGKRLRPFLAVETARLLGRDGAGGLRAGAAIELVHCYSLVHDDLPAMDDDDLRRGKPTVHRAYDEATAILVGDALRTLAFETLADPATDPDPSVRADLVFGLARASGLGGMVRRADARPRRRGPLRRGPSRRAGHPRIYRR